MKTFPLLATLCLLIPATFAQERTVGGPLQTEASWAALQNRIEATNGNVATLRADVDAMKKCNLMGKIHAPGVEGADANGCKSTMPKFSKCHDRAGAFGTHVNCGQDQVVTKVCGVGRNPDCIARAGTIMIGSGAKETVLTAPTPVFSVITCCSLE